MNKENESKLWKLIQESGDYLMGQRDTLVHINYFKKNMETFTDVGEAFGSFLEKEVKGGKFKTKKQR